VDLSDKDSHKGGAGAIAEVAKQRCALAPSFFFFFFFFFSVATLATLVCCARVFSPNI